MDIEKEVFDRTGIKIEKTETIIKICVPVEIDNTDYIVDLERELKDDEPIRDAVLRVTQLSEWTLDPTGQDINSLMSDASAKMNYVRKKVSVIRDLLSGNEGFEENVLEIARSVGFSLAIKHKQLSDIFVFKNGSIEITAYMEKPFRESIEGGLEYFYPPVEDREKMLLAAINEDFYAHNAEEYNKGWNEEGKKLYFALKNGFATSANLQ